MIAGRAVAIHSHFDRAHGAGLVMKGSNYHNTREAWLRAATNELRPFFQRCGYELPQNIRFAMLRERLQALAAALGPLPHAQLYIEQQPMTIRGSVGICSGLQSSDGGRAIIGDFGSRSVNPGSR